MEGSRDVQASGLRPFDFERGEAVAYAVRQIEQEIGRGGQHVELLTYTTGDFFGPLVLCAARQNLPVQRQQRPFTLADFRRQVLATVFHVRKQNVLFGNVAVVRRLQNRGQAGRRQAVGHVAPPFQIEHGRHAAARFRLPGGKSLFPASRHFEPVENHVHPP